MATGKLAYPRDSARKLMLRQGMVCPSCGTQAGHVVDRKYLITALRRCDACGLLYRTPTTSVAENRVFYQAAYAQGLTTYLPSDQELELLLKNRFQGKNDYQGYIDVLDAIGCKNGDRLLEFGCSWGYGSWQLRQRGFEVESFEISQPRAKYAREKLGIHIRELTDIGTGSYDIFFSAHVLEHVPSVNATVELALRALKPGGVFVAFTPNGSAAFRSRNPASWHQMWGNVHPQLLDEVYYKSQFKAYDYVMDSLPFDLNGLKQWAAAQSGPASLDLSGELLLCVCRKPLKQA